MAVLAESFNLEHWFYGVTPLSTKCLSENVIFKIPHFLRTSQFSKV